MGVIVAVIMSLNTFPRHPWTRSRSHPLHCHLTFDLAPLGVSYVVVFCVHLPLLLTQLTINIIHVIVLVVLSSVAEAPSVGPLPGAVAPGLGPVQLPRSS